MTETISISIVCSIAMLLFTWCVVLFITDKRRRHLHTVTVSPSIGSKFFAIVMFVLMYALFVLSAVLPDRIDVMIIAMVFSGIFALGFAVAAISGLFGYTYIGENGLTSVNIFRQTIFTAYDKISFYNIGGYNPNIHYIGNNVIYYCYDNYGRHICTVESSLKTVARFTNKMTEHNIPLQSFPEGLKQTPEYKQYLKAENRKFFVLLIAFIQAILIIIFGIIIGTAL